MSDSLSVVLSAFSWIAGNNANATDADAQLDFLAKMKDFVGLLKAKAVA